jgi:mRNA-degrading endonuclease toxin of MazEF toxin-antitoxin module
MNPNEIRRGQIYYIYLDPAFGSELAGFKFRPVVVVSVNSLHHQTQMITVIPGTSVNEERSFRNGIIVDPNDVETYSNYKNPIENPTLFQCHQIRAVSQGRFTQRARGRVSEKVLADIEDGLRFCLGLAPE